MASKDKGCTHPTRIDRRSLMQGETNYHEGEELEVVPDTGSKHDPLVLDR